MRCVMHRKLRRASGACQDLPSAHGGIFSVGVNELDALAVIRIHRTLSGPRPIVNPLARLIGVTVALYSDGTVERPLEPYEIRYLNRRERQRAKWRSSRRAPKLARLE